MLNHAGRRRASPPVPTRRRSAPGTASIQERKIKNRQGPVICDCLPRSRFLRLGLMAFIIGALVFELSAVIILSSNGAEKSPTSSPTITKTPATEKVSPQEPRPPPVDQMPERNKPGPLQHGPSNLCLHPRGGGTGVQEGNQLIMYEGCFREKRITYKWTDAGELQHLISGKCVVPASMASGGSGSVNNNDRLVLSDNCEKSRFSVLPNGSIKYTAASESGSDLCIHVEGGIRSPRQGTHVVLHVDCGLERNQFFLITQEPIDLRKKLSPPKLVSPENRPKRVAVSILITKDPGPSGGFIDSAATLVQSVINAKSKYNIELIAIVSRDVVQCRYGLERMGFRIIEKDLPLQAEEIRNPRIAQEIKTDGCCGIWELLKLHAWTLTEYDRILQLDTDIMFHRNFDELFEYDATLVWTHGALGGSEVLNGGFLVVRPNPQHYKEMVEIIKSGDFRDGRGWRGKCCWVYGGRTIQGIVPYYYLYEKPEDQYEVDRCQYNNMVEIDRCKTWRMESVTSNHFTVCAKPFLCQRPRNELCKQFSRRWWDRSHEVEDALGLPHRPECKFGYKTIDWTGVPQEKILFQATVT